MGFHNQVIKRAYGNIQKEAGGRFHKKIEIIFFILDFANVGFF